MKKRKTHFSDVVVFISLAAVILYTVANIYFSITDQYMMNDTLTTCWFAFFGAELASLAAIKTSKTKHGSKQDEPTDSDDEVG